MRVGLLNGYGSISEFNREKQSQPHFCLLYTQAATAHSVLARYLIINIAGVSQLGFWFLPSYLIGLEKLS